MKSGHALLRLAVDVRRGEVAAMLLSLYFFCLMAAYYPLRNFRDVIGSLGGAGRAQRALHGDVHRDVPGGAGIFVARDAFPAGCSCPWSITFSP